MPDSDDDDDKHRHPVVVVLPQLPVQVPVAVPYAPARIATGSGSTSTATARPQPVVTPACTTAADIPALGAAIDQLLPTVQLSDADMSKITELRQLIQMLATDGKVAAARDVEEDAMNRLGYQKVWLRCGLGTFEWQKQAATTQASQVKYMMAADPAEATSQGVVSASLRSRRLRTPAGPSQLPFDPLRGS